MPDISEMETLPSPARLSEYAFAFQRTAALRAAMGLDLFTAICEGFDTTPRLAARCEAAERGVRILCDYLIALELLTKEGERYTAAPEAAFYLNRGSPAFVGDAVGFLASETQVRAALGDPAAFVRKGGTVLEDTEHLAASDHPDWSTYARAMALIMARSAAFLADLVTASGERVERILDIAAGPGQSGITLVQRLPEVRVTAVDWPGVLEVARRNAQAAGVAERWQALPGSALDVPLGGPYDVALVVRFLHLLSSVDCERFLRRVHGALVPGGRVVALQVTLNDDHVSPPFAAMMNFNVLATTPSGRIRSAAEMEALLRRTGFTRLEWQPLPDSEERAVVGWKQT